MIRTLALTALAGSLLALTGCDDDSSPLGNRLTITGTAAMGAPIVSGEVRARGANGVMSTIGVTDANGNFTVRGIGMTLPIVLRVKNGFYDSNPGDLLDTPDTNAETQVAMVYTTSSTTLNLTPLTTLTTQLASGAASADAVYDNWEDGQPTEVELETAKAVVRANLDSVGSTEVTGWATYDFFTEPFDVDQPGIDDVLDAVICGATESTTVAGTLEVACSGGIVFDQEIATEGFVEGSAGGDAPT